jgi:DNA-binding transcriptional MerR regulator
MSMYRIGALARQTGCKVETIRFYESEGLLPVPTRGARGHRLYTDADQRRLLFIRRARSRFFDG